MIVGGDMVSRGAPAISFCIRGNGFMDIGVRDKHGFRIIDVVGKIDRIKDSIVLKSCVTTTVAEDGVKYIAMNLAQVTYMDSGALNVLISSHNALEKAGGKLVLIEPNEYVTDVLNIVGFDKLITIFSSEKEFFKNAKKI
jgi:anti-sigma B factor antagonist